MRARLRNLGAGFRDATGGDNMIRLVLEKKTHSGRLWEGVKETQGRKVGKMFP